MIRTQVSLDEKAYRAAKAQAKRDGISIAEFMRRALAVALASSARRTAGEPGGAEDDRPWMQFAGCVNSGDPRASETVDEVVYGRTHP